LGTAFALAAPEEEKSVDTKWRLCTHPDENIFEDYYFDRLSEQETAIFEEHLLICQECQKTLASTKDYIGLMKGATLADTACVRSQRNSAAAVKRGSLGNNVSELNTAS
jgi:hypothetical protein